MDFRPNQGRRRKRKKKSNPLVFLLPVAMLLGLFGLHTHTSNEIDRISLEIEEFKQTGSEYEQVTSEYRELQEREARINRTLSLVEGLTDADAGYTDLIERLTTRLPGITSDRQAYVRTLRLNEANLLTFDNADVSLAGQQVEVNMSGFARDPAAVANLVNDFERDPAYETLLHQVSRAGDEYEFSMNLVALIPDNPSEEP